MIRRSISKLLAVSLAAAALTAFAAPAQAAVGDATPSAQGWCDHVPLFCERRCGTQTSARCNPPPT